MGKWQKNRGIMKRSKLMSLGLVGLYLCLAPASLLGWERPYPLECKIEKKQLEDQYHKDKWNCRHLNGQEAKNCKAKAEKNKKDNEEKAKQCKKDAEENNEASFAGTLSSSAKIQYDTFTWEQKVKAMNHADKNKMSPDDSVARVYGTIQH